MLKIKNRWPVIIRFFEIAKQRRHISEDIYGHEIYSKVLAAIEKKCPYLIQGHTLKTGPYVRKVWYDNIFTSPVYGEIEEWCDTTFEDIYYFSRHSIHCRSSEDLLLFKLTWL